MAKKVYYSKPLKYFWKDVYGHQKKLTPNLSDQEIFRLLKRNLLSRPLGPDENQDSRSLAISGLDLWRKDALGELLHIFFLDKQLRLFLENIPLSSFDNIKKFLYENGENSDIFHYYSNTKTKSITYNFGLHLPYEGEGYAFSLSINENNFLELYFAQGENGGRMSDEYYNDLLKKSDDISVTIAKMFRLAINTIAYMNCFPDCVEDGVPKDLFEKSTNAFGKNVSLQLSDKIRETDISPTSKIPHFRKGHFRVLRSDYFAKKKGQIVFVAETMVKGKAKTVSLSSEIEKFTGDLSRAEN